MNLSAQQKPGFYLDLQPNHAYVIFGLAALIIEYHIIVIYTSSVRKKTFTPSFLASNFSKIHSNSNFPDDLTNLNGNPDPGDGLYADKLPYDLNINFNKARRAHYNFLENYFDVMILAFIAGIAFPLTSASILYVIVFMRALYTIYYLTPQGSSNPIRGLSSGIAFLSKFALVVMAVWASILFFTRQ